MVMHWNPTPSRPTLPPRHVPRHAAPSRIDRPALAVLVAGAVALASVAGMYALRALSGLGL